jgi:hypothetical protein
MSSALATWLVRATLVAGAGACVTPLEPAYRVPYVETKGPPTPDTLVPPSWGVGLATPLELLVFHDHPAAPKVCRDAGRLLRALRHAIADDHAGNNCDAVLEPQDGVATLRLSCATRTLPNGCVDRYTASLWVERECGSDVDYRVLAFSWIRRTCQRPVPDLPFQLTDEPALRSRLGRPSDRLGTFLRACEPPGPTS